MTKLLVVGNGGREHALLWHLKRFSPEIVYYCAPGNAGTENIAHNVPINPRNIGALAAFCDNEGIDFTMVGGEEPLSLGIVDLFQARGLRIFGPTKAAARLETEKAYAKGLMEKLGVPTPSFRVFTEKYDAFDYLTSLSASHFPLVVKASGLAGGKGVFICGDVAEALYAVSVIMGQKKFGSAGDLVVIEDYIEGEELSFFALVNGDEAVTLGAAQDYKRLLTGHGGPNTGGMGAICFPYLLDPGLEEKIMSRIIYPTIHHMKKKGHPYTGILYAGLIIQNEDPYLLEFNCRFGDPETQALVRQFTSDLLPSLMQVSIGSKDLTVPTLSSDESCCVILASPGYPDAPMIGHQIYGLDDAKKISGVEIFHSGTILTGERLTTNGGRVLSITAQGKKPAQLAYQAISRVYWEGMQFRTDIGK